jgi:hypothetical protein
MSFQFHTLLQTRHRERQGRRYHNVGLQGQHLLTKTGNECTNPVVHAAGIACADQVSERDR